MKWTIKIVLALFLLSLFQGWSFFHPKKLNSANFTSASATLGNSRLSYRAGVSGTPGAGSVTINIDTSGNADVNTNHLFRQDTVCFPDAGLNGCSDETEYTVSSIVDTDTFTITPGLVGALEATDYAVATQSGSLTITFTTVNVIPSDGDLFITIPAINNANEGCDGLPDYDSTLANNGFDLKGIAAGDITTTGCTNNDWVATETISCKTDGTDHTITIARQTSACAASSTVTVAIDSAPGVINPAPSNTTQGTAENYTINVKSRNSGGNTLDESDVIVAPIEAVFVSATVEETLTFQVTAVTADDTTVCGVTRTSSSPDSTVYSVPFGAIATTYAAATHNAAQQLTVTTNADGGYKVYVEESDQMGKDGATCTGTAPSSGDFTFGSATCIRDTLCGTTPCTHTAAYDWGADPSSYPGLGYSLENVGGDTDAKFVYNSDASPCDATAGLGAFCAKEFADTQGGEDKTDTNAEAMTNSDPVDSKDVYVCFRIDVPGTQPAGYYYNKVSYTAVPIF